MSDDDIDLLLEIIRRFKCQILSNHVIKEPSVSFFMMSLVDYEWLVKLYKCIAFILVCLYNIINKVLYTKERCIIATKSVNLFVGIEPVVKKQV